MALKNKPFQFSRRLLNVVALQEWRFDLIYGFCKGETKMGLTESATREFLLRFNVHTRSIRANLAKIASDLANRAAEHDDAKLSDEQLEQYIARHQEIHPLPYGSPEREPVEKKYEKLVEGHKREYRHHPEYFPNQIDDMNLVDVIEMVCDWAAAGKDLDNSLKQNEARYHISPQVMKLIRNTIKDFGIKGV